MLIEYWLLVCCCCFNKFLHCKLSELIERNKNFTCTMTSSFFLPSILYCKVCTYVRVPHTLCILVILTLYSQFQFSCSFRFVDAWLSVFSYCSAGAHKFLYTCTLAVHSKFCRNPGHPSKVVQTGKLCIFVVIWCHLFTILHNWCSVYHCSFSFTVGKYMYNTFKKML